MWNYIIILLRNDNFQSFLQRLRRYTQYFISLNYIMYKPQNVLIIYPVHPTTIKYYKFTTVFITQNKLVWCINYFYIRLAK